MLNKTVIVIGAGASGMMAAGRAAESGASVMLLEKTEQPGKKILISGKTRCNLTNSKELDEFITMYGVNGNFLYRAFNRFFRKELLEFLSRYGVETKTERGGRIFPVSDDAEDIVKAFKRYLADNKVQIKTGASVNKILVENGCVPGVQAGTIPYLPLPCFSPPEVLRIRRQGQPATVIAWHRQSVTQLSNCVRHWYRWWSKKSNVPKACRASACIMYV